MSINVRNHHDVATNSLLICGFTFILLIATVQSTAIINYQTYATEKNKCDANEYFDPQAQQCRKFGGGGRAIFVDHTTTCANHFIGVKPHPDTDKFYYMCQPDSVVIGECTGLMRFNENTLRCERMPKYPCNIQRLPECSSPGRFAIAENCSCFYICDLIGENLTPKLYQCPGSSIYSPVKQKCSYNCNVTPTEVLSSNASELQSDCFPPCTKPGRFRTPTDCAKYYTCSAKTNGRFYQTRYKCPSGFFYDIKKERCGPADEVTCKIMTVTELLNLQEYYNKQKYEQKCAAKEQRSNEYENDEQDSVEGFYSDENKKDKKTDENGGTKPSKKRPKSKTDSNLSTTTTSPTTTLDKLDTDEDQLTSSTKAESSTVSIENEKKLSDTLLPALADTVKKEIDLLVDLAADEKANNEETTTTQNSIKNGEEKDENPLPTIKTKSNDALIDESTTTSAIESPNKSISSESTQRTDDTITPPPTVESSNGLVNDKNPIGDKKLILSDPEHIDKSEIVGSPADEKAESKEATTTTKSKTIETENDDKPVPSSNPEIIENDGNRSDLETVIKTIFSETKHTDVSTTSSPSVETSTPLDNNKEIGETILPVTEDCGCSEEGESVGFSADQTKESKETTATTTTQKPTPISIAARDNILSTNTESNANPFDETSTSAIDRSKEKLKDYTSAVEPSTRPVNDKTPIVDPEKKFPTPDGDDNSAVVGSTNSENDPESTNGIEATTKTISSKPFERTDVSTTPPPTVEPPTGVVNDIKPINEKKTQRTEVLNTTPAIATNQKTPNESALDKYFFLKPYPNDVPDENGLKTLHLTVTKPCKVIINFDISKEEICESSSDKTDSPLEIETNAE